MERKSFSKENPVLQIAWDATSLKEATCPRKYEYSMLRGWKLNTYHLDYGTYYHDAMEAVEHHYAVYAGDDDGAALVGARHALASSVGFESPDNRKSRRTLVRAVIWRVLEYGNNLPILKMSDGSTSTETSFSIPLGVKAYTGDDYVLCGHMDGVVNFMGEIAVLERKTSVGDVTKTTYQKNFTPDTQVSMYHAVANTLWDNVVGVLVEAVQSGVTFNRFHRFIAKRYDTNIDEFFHDCVSRIRTMERYAQEGYWPKDENVCDKYGGCPFKQVCSAPGSMKEEVLAGGMYEQRFWDPIEVRE